MSVFLFSLYNFSDEDLGLRAKGLRKPITPLNLYLNTRVYQILRYIRDTGEGKKQCLRTFPPIFLRYSLVQYDSLGFEELEVGSRIWLP